MNLALSIGEQIMDLRENRLTLMRQKNNSSHDIRRNVKNEAVALWPITKHLTSDQRILAYAQRKIHVKTNVGLMSLILRSNREFEEAIQANEEKIRKLFSSSQHIILVGRDNFAPLIGGANA